MKFNAVAFLFLQSSLWEVHCFAPSNHVSATKNAANLKMAGGEGGDKEWAKALLESTAAIPGEFENEMKMKGLLGKKGTGDTKLSANAELVKWLEEEGGVYLSEESAWGEAPHPMAISTETKDEITNESSGRGLLARRDVNDGDNLFKIPLKLCITKDSARKALGKDVLPRDINDYLAIACQLIHERDVLGDESFWKPYFGVLPETDEVNPTFTWSDEDLAFLEGSPVVAATRSLQLKLQREYDDLLGGENGLCNKYPDRFPKEVRKLFSLLWCSRRSNINLAGFVLAAFHIRKLGVGFYDAFLSCYPSSKLKGRRDACYGALRRPNQSLAIFSSLHRRKGRWRLALLLWRGRSHFVC